MRAQRVCEMYGVECDGFFAIKSIMKKRPISFLCFFGIGSIFLFGLCLRICERPLIRPFLNSNGELTQDDNNRTGEYIHSLWCVILTMTTVGYGDYYPRTILGRTVVFFCSIWGVFIVALMVTTLQSFLNLSNLECKASLVLKKVYTKMQIKKEAACVLQKICKISQLKKKKQIIKQDQIYDLNIQLAKLKNIQRFYRTLVDDSSLSELLDRKFNKIKDYFEYYNQKQDLTLESQFEIMNQLGMPQKKAQEQFERIRKISTYSELLVAEDTKNVSGHDPNVEMDQVDKKISFFQLNPLMMGHMQQ